MAGKVEKFQSPGKGNGLRAARDLDVGETVANAKPFVYTVCREKNRDTTCHHCLHSFLPTQSNGRMLQPSSIISGKHVWIVPPPKSGSYYFNYKGFCSIVMLAVVSANYEFLYLDVGKNGRNSDGGVIMQTEFYKRLQNGTLNLPPAEENVEGLNFAFLADEAFALKEHLMKPFPMRNLTPEQRIFNYRLSHARRVVENAFGILSSLFRLFLAPINLALYKINHVVLCCCILHNFLGSNATSYLASLPSDVDPAVAGPAEEAAARPSVGVLTAIEYACAGLPSQIARDLRQKTWNILWVEGQCFGSKL